MIIDIVFAVLLIMAAIKGYSRGLIVAVFSIIAFIVGLAAALKLSTVTANYLKESVNVNAQWLPVLSFAVVFFIVVLLVRWGANLVEKTFKVAMLGWINRLGGVALYAALYIILLSVFLFYAQKINLINADTVAASKTYSIIQPFAPKVIDGFGVILPWFKNMFGELEVFFGKIASNVAK